MVTIQVIGKDGRSLSGADVQISWRGFTHSTGRTDSSGRVSWNVSTGTGTVYVNGRQRYDGSIGSSLTVRA